MKCICPQCSAEFDRPTGEVNRAKSKGAPLYCGRACAGLARRNKNPPTPEERKAAKAEYDKLYREKNRESRRVKKAEYFKRTYDPAKAAIARKANMPKHVEYCRRPEYRAKKAEYDGKRNEMEYGDYAEVWRLLQDLEAEIRSRASSYEVRVQQGYYTRNAQKRRRELWQLMQKN